MSIKSKFHMMITMAICFLLLSLTATLSFAQGSFSGHVIVEWIDGQNEERDMRLIDPFAFTDPKGKIWSVPAGTTIDGASIPQALWSLVGSPYTGHYRRASVIHDYYCDTKSESWQDVHRMFYDAMLAGGVAEVQAKIFYAAVYAGGPRWKTIVTKNLEGSEEIITVPLQPTISRSLQDETNKWIQLTNPSLESIEKRLDPGITVH